MGGYCGIRGSGGDPLPQVIDVTGNVTSFLDTSHRQLQRGTFASAPKKYSHCEMYRSGGPLAQPMAITSQ